MLPKNPGWAKFATGPLAAATVLPIPPEANSNGDIPLFIAFRMPWFGCVCDCCENWSQTELALEIIQNGVLFILPEIVVEWAEPWLHLEIPC